METLPFDPAEYLDTEDARQAYLEDAVSDGPEAVARAQVVLARALALHSTGVSATPRRSAG